MTDPMEDGDTQDAIVHCEMEPIHDDEENVRLVELLAAVEGCEPTELPPLYARIDDVLEDLFTDPPDPAAQLELSFSYAGYRITVDQGGEVVLRDLEGAPAVDADAGVEEE